MRFKTFLTAVIILTGTALYSGTFADTNGYSAYGISMGNAMNSIVSDSSSLFYNISGLGKTESINMGTTIKETSMSLKRKRKADKNNKNKNNSKKSEKDANEISISFLYSIPQLKIDITRFDSTSGESLETNGDKNLHGGSLVFGIVFDINVIHPLPEVISSARLAVSVLTNADWSLLKINSINPRTHNFVRFGREIQKTMMLSGLGMGFLKDTFGFGIGMGQSFTGTGAIALEAESYSSDLQYPDGYAKFDLKMMPYAIAGLYFSPGQTFDVIRGLNFGVSYRMATDVKIDPYYTAASTYSKTVLLDTVISVYDYHSPHTISCGVSYSFRQFLFSVDVDVQLWALYKVFSEDEGGSNEMFRNIVIPKLGFQYQAFNWLAIMAGYNYHQYFILDTALTNEYNMLDNDRHTGSIGFKFTIPKMGKMAGPIDISIGYQFQYLVKRETVKIASTLENPDYTFGGFSHTAGIDISIKI